jgi:5-(hydroxymethyl)furfural/furfural oxidase
MSLLAGSTGQFDYVIAGGGSAGCVLASRLSENPHIRVLLLEAGVDLPPGQEPAEIRNPSPVVIFYGNRYLWPKLRVNPFRSRPNSTRFYEQGRVLGGGSSVNAQVGNRGIPDDYDEWERLGAAGWGWKDVLPFFRKLERDIDYSDNDTMHGNSGPIPICRVLRRQWPIFSRKLAIAVEHAGYADIVDQNAVFTEGYFPPAYTNEHGERVSASMAYLPAPVRARPNLTILTETLVTSVVFDGQRAVGLDYEQGAETNRALAGEVLLSLGALHSPAMLMRSGIAPKAVLEQHGITPRAVREGVGKNLRDHPGTHLCAYVKPHARMPKGLVKSGHIAMRFSSRVPNGLVSDLYMNSGLTSAWHGVGQRVAYFYLWLNKSLSTGEVTLRDTNPHSHPQVQMNLLDAPGDAERLADGFHVMAGILRDPGMKDVLETPFAVRFSPFIRFMSQIRPANRQIMGFLGRLLDGPRWFRSFLIRNVVSNAPPLDILLDDPERLKAYLKENAMSVSHVSGSCRMGAPSDPMAVVDTQGRVHGVQGLRVIDASIMPSIPRANINLPTYMIAEKIASAIMADRKKNP